MNRTRSARFMAALVSLGLGATLMLTGCGNDAAPAPSDGPVNLTFWHSASGASAESLDAIVKKFNEANEGKIAVEATYQGKYDDTIAKLSASVQGGQLPDLVQINDVNTAFMVDSDLIIPADQLMKDAKVGYAFDELVPVVSNYYTVDGSVVSMPFQVSQPAIFVRNDVLAATGITVEQFPVSVAELTAWAAEAKDATGKAGLSFHLNPWWFEELSATAGLDYCTPDNGRGGKAATAFVLADDAQVAQWTAFQEAFATGAALNVGTDFSAVVNAFASGEAGAMFSSSGALGTVQQAMTTEWSVVPFPVDSVEGGVVPGGNSVFAISSSLDSNAKKTAAAEFLAYLGSDEVQETSFKDTGFLPSTNKALTAAKASANVHQVALLEQLANTKDTSASAGCFSGALQQIRGELTPAIELIVRGSNVRDTLEPVEQAAVGIVESYNQRAGK